MQPHAYFDENEVRTSESAGLFVICKDCLSEAPGLVTTFIVICFLREGFFLV